MVLEPLKLLPAGFGSLDLNDEFKLSLEVFSEVYETQKLDTEKALILPDLDRCPIWALFFIARMLGAEILRLNELENSNMDLDSNGDGLADNWTTSGTVTGGIVLRRNDNSQKLTLGNAAKFHQALTLGAVEKFVMEAKVRVTSGSVRLGDTLDSTKTVLITAADSDDTWSTYGLMFTPNSGSRNYGLWAQEAGTVAYIDHVWVTMNSKQALMRVWLRNVVTEYKRKGCKDGLSSVVSYLTGETVSSYVEQMLKKHALVYGDEGSEYMYFGVNGAPNPNAGPPGDPTLYSVEWNTLGTANDVNSVYLDFGSVLNGNFDSGLTSWVAGAGTGLWGAEKSYSGSKSVKLTGASLSFYQDSVTVTASTRYVLSAWVWIPAGFTWSQMPRLLIKPSGGGAAIVTGTAALATQIGKWQELTVVLPNTNAVTNLRVELEATATSGSAYLYTDFWWMQIRRWLKINVTDPGAGEQANMRNLLENVLVNYVPVGVDIEVAFV